VAADRRRAGAAAHGPGRSGRAALGAFTPVADGIVAEVECGQPGPLGRGG
jgi:hypothetical protein